uniref:Uncharacterized protein n=2 Tax=Aegilops tauschii TaxID=37682 RepID=A0A453A200_AEGTS
RIESARSMALLDVVAWRLCDLVLGRLRGLFEPTAVGMNVDDVALAVFNHLRNNPTEGDKDLPLAEVTRIFKALSEVQNKDGAATSNIASLH